MVTSLGRATFSSAIKEHQNNAVSIKDKKISDAVRVMPVILPRLKVYKVLNGEHTLDQKSQPTLKSTALVESLHTTSCKQGSGPMATIASKKGSQADCLEFCNCNTIMIKALRGVYDRFNPGLGTSKTTIWVESVATSAFLIMLKYGNQIIGGQRIIIAENGHYYGQLFDLKNRNNHLPGHRFARNARQSIKQFVSGRPDIIQRHQQSFATVLSAVMRAFPEATVRHSSRGLFASGRSLSGDLKKPARVSCKLGRQFQAHQQSAAYEGQSGSKGGKSKKTKYSANLKGPITLCDIPCPK
ncbi:hypothetical protein I304_04056 [Cryptococcus deuterogattii CBS 10090]|nr:hypothetical protein I304_04056 [Cryptococcus deuterogattii CBS 10090]